MMRQCLWEELKVQFSGTGGEGCFVTFLHSHAGTHPSPKVPENVSKFGCGAAPRGAMWVGAETAKQEWQPAESCCRRCGKEKQAGGLKFWVQVKARLSQKFCICTGAQEPSCVNATTCTRLGQAEQPKCPDFNGAVAWDLPLFHYNRGFHETQLAR